MPAPPPLSLQPADALLVIDMQNDFVSAVNGRGGALAVAGGHDIVSPIKTLASRFAHVVLTQDWHPRGHISFATTHPGKEPFETIAAPYGAQALWPEHCLQHTHGAELHPELDIPHAELILRKGYKRDLDSYSAFVENDHTTPTGLAGYLRERGLKRLFVCGLAYDFCVRHTAVDGKQLGFETLVVEDASRAVDLPGTVDATNDALARLGIPRVLWTQIHAASAR